VVCGVVWCVWCGVWCGVCGVVCVVSTPTMSGGPLRSAPGSSICGSGFSALALRKAINSPPFVGFAPPSSLDLADWPEVDARAWSSVIYGSLGVMLGTSSRAPPACSRAVRSPMLSCPCSWQWHQKRGWSDGELADSLGEVMLWWAHLLRTHRPPDGLRSKVAIASGRFRLVMQPPSVGKDWKTRRHQAFLREPCRVDVLLQLLCWWQALSTVAPCDRLLLSVATLAA